MSLAAYVKSVAIFKEPVMQQNTISCYFLIHAAKLL
jgi:hypothetical protein